ncbi:hypothetical protein ETF27_06450 [Prevotella brunnea]|uniref:Uncharacterized protein n=1 Tax=Prevotella brunnea TaxID=2508867 RepID=A0A5C8GJ99_9BACT|nr:hypothetical protein [Prevotella brunnea]MDR0185826.1 hypothetical protein [Prevotella brunnea]TXJ62010.1 hypothetical protein ETF27_06450 [Prevotella brunnea]
MRKIALTIALTLVALTGIKAQNRVYQQIYRSAYKVATNKQEDTEARKVASFKVDAISYLQTKTLIALSTQDDKALTAEEVKHLNSRLDSMAYYMYSFVNLFTKEYTKAADEKEKSRVIKIFRNASINHPLYNDNDKELVHAYYNRNDYPTQFSLDTNWIDALEEVKKKL